jgi:DNA-binding transcriptional MerR regulator
MIDAIQDQLASIPEKTYFRIGEVAKLVAIEPYVLRFWETEFKTMVPPKSRSKQRMYRRKDLETILVVKHLLYVERFTIEGARKHLEARAKAEPAAIAAGKKAKAVAKKLPKGQAGLFDVPSSAMDTVRKELADILQLLR